MNLIIIQVDYCDSRHAQDLVFLLNHYASDVSGGGKPLSESVKKSLAQELSKRPDAFSFLAYDNEQPIGLINCIEGFSTFAAKPLMNVHDVIVHADHRGHGIASKMLKEVQQISQQRGCCKMTLEVLSNNESAKRVYERFGFTEYQLDPSFGTALFMQMPL